MKEEYILDEIYGERLLISPNADQTELNDNIRVARVHLSNKILKTKKIVSGIYGRHEDFTSGTIDECYMVHNNTAIVVKSHVFDTSNINTTKQLLSDLIEKQRT